MTTTPHPTTSPCHVVELRQYPLHPGKREALIELFDRAFIETQQAVGLTVRGQLRDLDDADQDRWPARPTQTHRLSPTARSAIPT